MVLVKKIVFSAVLLAMSVILNAQQKPAGQEKLQHQQTQEQALVQQQILIQQMML